MQDEPHSCIPFEIRATNLPVFRLFGITPDQHSVTCHVHGFLPYFYIPCPSSICSDASLQEFHERLQFAIRESDKAPPALFRTEIVERTNLYGFVPKTTHQRYIRITCTSPNAMNTAKRKT